MKKVWWGVLVTFHRRDAEARRKRREPIRIGFSLETSIGAAEPAQVKTPAPLILVCGESGAGIQLSGRAQLALPISIARLPRAASFIHISQRTSLRKFCSLSASQRLCGENL